MARIISATTISEQLYKLSLTCDNNISSNKLSNYVFFAVDRYIRSGRASVAFCKKFINLPDENMGEMIEYCLEKSTSDDGIMEAVKGFLNAKVTNNESGIFVRGGV